MARSRIFLFILLNVFQGFNCLLQRSNWTYDPNTHLVTFASNGITFSCLSWDIIMPSALREFDSLHGPCQYGSVEAALDPACVHASYLRSMGDYSLTNIQSPCSTVQTPKITDTLGRIENVYRSTSFDSVDDNPATQQWYDKVVSENLTQLGNYDCHKNESKVVLQKKLDMIREMATIALNNAQYYIPVQRANVSDSQIVVEEALKREDYEVNLERLFVTSYAEHIERERLLALELLALEEDSGENGPIFWYLLAQQRSRYVGNMSRNMKLESLTAGARKIVKTKMNILCRMAAANEMLARIHYLARKIAFEMKPVCPQN